MPRPPEPAPPAAGGSSPPDPPKRHPAWAWARRVALGVWLVWGTWRLYVAGGFPQECHQEAVNDVVTRMCQDVPATDARVLLYLLVVAVLLLPEVTEIEIPGLVRVKRELDKVHGEVEQTKSAVAQVRDLVQLSMIQFSARQTSTQTQSNAWNVVLPGGGAGAVAQVQEDLNSDDTTPLTDEEWEGGARELAFRAAFTGLRNQLAPPLGYESWPTAARIYGFVGGVLDQPPQLVHESLPEDLPDPDEQRVRDEATVRDAGLTSETVLVLDQDLIVTAPFFPQSGGSPLAWLTLALPRTEDTGASDDADGSQRAVAVGRILANVYGMLIANLLGEWTDDPV